MNEDDGQLRRVRFYGVGDLATGWYLHRVVDLASRFDPDVRPTNLMDVLELHNVQQYLEHEILPAGLVEDERQRILDLAPAIGRAVARFFTEISGENVTSTIAVVEYQYHSDLVRLLERYGAYGRIEAERMLSALRATGVQLAEMLASKKLVQAYGEVIRRDLIANPRNAEVLLRKHLEKDAKSSIYTPAEFTPADARALIEGYLPEEYANLNYVRLIATAKDLPQLGIDAKLRLSAKRRGAELSAQLFAEGDGFKTGCDVRIEDDQREPVVFDVDSSDGSVWRYSYSRGWLEDATDNPSILNNFQHLFEFTDHQVLLTLPSYTAALGVMERVMGLTGVAEYKVGLHFQTVNARSLLQTLMLHDFLQAKAVDLEKVICWFFEEYLVEEFGIANFTFTPSGKDVPYLQKVRHLFAEMESVANQFGLYAENGELDRELLSMGSAQVQYKEIPSLLGGKYVYAAENAEVTRVLNLLFSDQSPLLYINEGLRGDNAVALLLDNSLARDDFHDYQKGSIDYLIDEGILKYDGAYIRFADLGQLVVLRSIFSSDAASYHHLSHSQRSHVDMMVAKGWVVRRSSLLTASEGDYFNFFLNRVGFSNGLNLRNSYLHGSQENGDGDDRVHFNTYLIALRLTIALVIKMNDDICLSMSTETSGVSDRGAVGDGEGDSR